jgi:ribosomal protein S18 acetylase RimI-like enzyme
MLAAYDAQLREHVPDPLPRGVTVERDGPLLRFFGLFGPGNRGFISYRDLQGLDGDALDELIERQVRVFDERGEQFEWKLHAHDRPSDLPRRLRAAGFVPEDEETVMIAVAAEVANRPLLPEGVKLRKVTERSDFDRIAVFEQTAWGDGEDQSWIAAMLEIEQTADPEGLSVVVAEADGAIVCAAWVRFQRGTGFATLWGGATLPKWRGRGIYRAIVAHRASLATERGFRFLEVDASDDSRPILQRLGFTAVTTTTPYVWSPPTVPA